MIKKITNLYKNKYAYIVFILTLLLCFYFGYKNSFAASLTLNSDSGNGQGFGPLEVLFFLVLISLGPSIIIMMTSFTRLIISLSFLRNALGTAGSPPNQILVGIALFLTLFIMQPVFNEINEQAYIPYKNNTITQTEAIQRGIGPLKTFMIKQIQKKDLQLFLSITNTTIEQDPNLSEEENLKRLGLSVIVPSFITSELKRAFIIGFLIFIPFLIIDMVVSSTLLSMGMVMLPPGSIALPFKLLMFILVDGWNLLFGTLTSSFRV